MSAHPAHDWPVVIPQAARRYARGESLKAIAESLDVCQETIIAQREKHLSAWQAAFHSERPPVPAPVVTGPTLDTLLERYVLARDLMPRTVDYYGRVVSCINTWYGGPVPLDAFDVELVNKFLHAKQVAGRAWMYRRSLRNALRAMLNFVDKPGKLRPVRWEGLHPTAWTPEEVQRLIDAAPDDGWRTRIALAYFTGLNQVDLERVEKRHIVSGVLEWRRSKTGKLVKVRVPDWLVDRLPPSGPVCPRTCSEEWVRRVFARMVKAAGLAGTMKVLRKSSGTLVESQHPGCGHLHLGNTRAVFELHYMNPERGLTALSPPALPAMTK